MDRAMLIEHLALAERHVRTGTKNIARQKQIIAELEADGHDTAEACRALRAFEATPALSFTDQERIKKELEQRK